VEAVGTGRRGDGGGGVELRRGEDLLRLGVQPCVAEELRGLPMQ
jgi:hypothetical protein